MKIFYSPDFVGAEYGFDTTRKARWVAESLAACPIATVDVAEPSPLTVCDIELVHDRNYTSAVRCGKPLDLAQSQGFDWDPGLWQMVLSSNGGVLAAARAALVDGVAGSLSSGLHHAKHDRGEGFCTFNGLVIAAKRLLNDGDVGSVLIIDLDAHCGGGTAQLIEDDRRIWHADVSVSAFDDYSGYANSALRVVDDADAYMLAIQEGLAQASHLGPFDLCLYNAGMDPYQGCDIGGLDGITAEVLARREQHVFDWCRERGLPVAFVLAGGYLGTRLDTSTLVDLHRMTITAAASPGQPDNTALRGVQRSNADSANAGAS